MQERRHLAGVAVLALALAGALPVARTATASAGGRQLSLVGMTSLRGAAGSASLSGGATSTETGPGVPLVQQAPLTHVPASEAPRVAANPVVGTQLSGFAGFSGITHADQRLSGTGVYANTNFSLEPPDQGLCVGNGFVLETVNDALRVFDTSGAPQAPTVALNEFFQAKPAIIRTGPTFGDFISDPKCYFDPGAGRFFLTALHITLDPVLGTFEEPTHNYIAVSMTGDPTGSWFLFKLDVTDDGSNGTPTHPNCPCFGDQPLIGADANGFYISTNEYNLHPFGSAFNGAQLYAISKADLVAGVATPVMQQFDAGPSTAGEGGPANSLQPATSPNSGFETAAGGTEYLMMAEDFSRVLTVPRHSTPVNHIAVFALTNTSSLNTATPSLALSHVSLSSEVYGQPPDAEQRHGEIPLGDLVHDPEGLLAADDDRMNQVVFANGKLWSGTNTAVQPPNGPTRVGTTFFVVTPTVSGGGVLDASITKQGYVAVNQNNLLYPSIGVTDAGNAVMVFTLVGPNFFPSAAYTSISVAGGAGAVHIAAAGVAPDDGFTCYKKAAGGSGTGRWGDYSAAVADTSGTVWMATEFIPGGPRTLLANWGTFVNQVTP